MASAGGDDWHHSPGHAQSEGRGGRPSEIAPGGGTQLLPPEQTSHRHGDSLHGGARTRGASFSSNIGSDVGSLASLHTDSLKDQYWVHKVKNIGRGNRASATYDKDGKQFTTRADSLGRRGLLDYGMRAGRSVKRDWICVCETSNFERNSECRNCRRSKVEGLRQEIDVDLSKKQGKVKPKQQNPRDNHINDRDDNYKENENSTSKGQPRRRPGGRGRGAMLRCRAGKTTDGEDDPVVMKFASKTNFDITIEELDEALSVEGKDASEIESATRTSNSTLVILKDKKKLKNWRKIGSHPVKVSSSTIYLGVSDKLKGNEIKIRLSGIPPQMNREEIVEWLSWYGTIKSNLKIRKIVGNDSLKNVNGLIDRTIVEVNMELVRDFREKEVVEDMSINISYNNMPKTCWNCKKPGSECDSGGGQGYLCRTRMREVSWDEVYRLEDTEKEGKWKEVEERIYAAEMFDFEEEDFVIDRDSDSSGTEREKIPDNFKIAGIRVRGRGKMTKESCNELIGDLVDNLKQGGDDLQDALENGEVIEEEFKGEVKAFSILLDPELAETVWETVKDEKSCSPIIMSVTRWEEEKALRERLKAEKEEEERHKLEKKKEREEKQGKAKQKKDLMGYLKRQKNKLKRQTNVLKGEMDGWETAAKEGNVSEVKSALIRLNEIEKDIDLVLEEVEEDDSEFINQWRAEMLQLKATADEVNKYGGNILNSNGSIQNESDDTYISNVSQISGPQMIMVSNSAQLEEESSIKVLITSTEQPILSSVPDETSENVTDSKSESVDDAALEIVTLYPLEDENDSNEDVSSTDSKLSVPTNKQKEELSNDSHGMKERKLRLSQVKLRLSCPTDCSFKDCPLRVVRKVSKNCKCNTTRNNCYYCMTHVCQSCCENMDEHEAGVRKCEKGACKPEVLENWEKINGKIPEPSSKEKERKQSDKVAPTRCKSCIKCTESCDKLNKPPDSWCKACRNKKICNKARKACEFRGYCLKFLESEEGKIWLSQSETPQNKRKIEDSPILKQPKKTVKEDNDSNSSIGSANKTVADPNAAPKV